MSSEVYNKLRIDVEYIIKYRMVNGLMEKLGGRRFKHEGKIMRIRYSDSAKVFKEGIVVESPALILDCEELELTLFVCSMVNISEVIKSYPILRTEMVMGYIFDLIEYSANKLIEGKGMDSDYSIRCLELDVMFNDRFDVV